MAVIEQGGKVESHYDMSQHERGAALMLRDDIHALAIEIADEQSIVLIESYAKRAADQPRGVWDVSSPDEDEITGPLTVDGVREDIAKAVRYLDLRGKIVRPVAGQPLLVSLGSAA